MSNCKGSHDLAVIHSCCLVRIEWCRRCGNVLIAHNTGEATLVAMRLVEPPQKYRVLTDVPADILEWAKEIRKAS